MHLRVQSRTLNLMFSGACIFKFNLWLWTQVPSLTLNSSSTSIFELWYLSVTVYKSDCFHVHFMTKLSYTHTHEWRSIWNKKCGKKWIYKLGLSRAKLRISIQDKKKFQFKKKKISIQDKEILFKIKEFQFKIKKFNSR